jgi:hypothetical protein
VSCSLDNKINEEMVDKNEVLVDKNETLDEEAGDPWEDQDIDHVDDENIFDHDETPITPNKLDKQNNLDSENEKNNNNENHSNSTKYQCPPTPNGTIHHDDVQMELDGKNYINMKNKQKN